MANFKVTVEKKYGIISEGDSEYTKELRLVAWGDHQAKYDLRTWHTDKETGEETAGKGITLSTPELMNLKEIIDLIIKN